MDIATGIGDVHANCSNPIGPLAPWIEKAESVDVVIVGGGISGLAAARKLLLLGVTSLVVLEAQEKIGGRVQTYRKDDIVLDDGAQFIHGDGGNVINQIATNLSAIRNGIPDYAWDFRIIDAATNEENYDYDTFQLVTELMDETRANGILGNYYDSGYGQYYIDRFSEVFGPELEDALPKAWFYYAENRVMAYEGTKRSWLDISARSADQFIDYGEDHEWKNGYDTLINYITNDIDRSKIKTNTPVTNIVFDHADIPKEKGNALVITANGSSYLANQVLFTGSVGVLKEHVNCLFTPSLPNYLIDALQYIELGSPNKLFIGWEKKWWNNRMLNAHFLWTKFELPEEMSWLYGIGEMFSSSHNENILQMFVSGNYSEHMENLDEATVQKHLMFLISKLQKNEIPPPNFFRRTRWLQNPWTRGSYSSYITLEGDKNNIHSREIYRRPVVNNQNEEVLFFAGEHTEDGRYGTVDGAFVSGEREASRIQKIVEGNNAGK